MNLKLEENLNNLCEVRIENFIYIVVANHVEKYKSNSNNCSGVSSESNGIGQQQSKNQII